MSKNKPVVIAHRGACGYLPEHTLAAKAMAHSMGADYIEQDVVLSKDGVPVVLHDIHLDSTTDVAKKFPARSRDDGRFYAIDFSLAELKQLGVHERTRKDMAGEEVAVYPNRFPASETLFRIPTLAEEIALIAGMDRSRGRSTGLYIELKSPNWHQKQGQDIALAVLDDLEDSGYAGRTEQVYLQCFDDKTLRRLREDLNTPLPLIQLIGENAWNEDSAADYDFLRTPEGLAGISKYAAGIGPWLAHIYRGKDANGQVQFTDLVSQAHAKNLLVHPYTMRKDELLPGIATFTELLDIFIKEAEIDGMFTDFPDLAANYIAQIRS